MVEPLLPVAGGPVAELEEGPEPVLGLPTPGVLVPVVSLDPGVCSPVPPAVLLPAEEMLTRSGISQTERASTSEEIYGFCCLFSLYCRNRHSVEISRLPARPGWCICSVFYNASNTLAVGRVLLGSYLKRGWELCWS